MFSHESKGWVVQTIHHSATVKEIGSKNHIMSFAETLRVILAKSGKRPNANVKGNRERGK